MPSPNRHGHLRTSYEMLGKVVEIEAFRVVLNKAAGTEPGIRGKKTNVPTRTDTYGVCTYTYSPAVSGKAVAISASEFMTWVTRSLCLGRPCYHWQWRRVREQRRHIRSPAVPSQTPVDADMALLLPGIPSIRPSDRQGLVLETRAKKACFRI